MKRLSIVWVEENSVSFCVEERQYQISRAKAKDFSGWAVFLFWENIGNGLSLLVLGSKRVTKSCQTRHEALAKLYHHFQENGNGSVPDYLPDGGGNRKGAIKASVAKEVAESRLNLLNISIPNERTLFNISTLSGIKCRDISLY